jgi:GTP-binding protein Era
MKTRCAHVAIIGRANVGKSTLLNRILEQKVSITSRKPQTTRQRIVGIRTHEETQLIFVDTPGWQKTPKNRLNRLMNRQVTSAIQDVDLCLMVCDARGFENADIPIATMLTKADFPCFVALNKEDRVRDKKSILPNMAYLSEHWPIFESIFPICAKTGRGVGKMLQVLEENAPSKSHIFPSDQFTDHTEKFLCSELIREKTIRYLGDELPYSTTVVIEEYSEDNEITRIGATLWVERESQKAIVIGKEGMHLKKIATDARLEIEVLLQRKVYLRLWVKTQKGWMNNIDAIEITSVGN